MVMVHRTPFVFRRNLSPEEQFFSAWKEGAISLILGAGVSHPFGIPTWERLAEQLWADTFPDLPSPWSAKRGRSPRELPQFLPIVFERVANRLGEDAFLIRLRHFLYKDVKPLATASSVRANTSLAILARLLLDEFNLSGRRRVVRVITLNVDDLLLEAVKKLGGKPFPLRFVARSTTRWTERSDERMPVYYIHGWIPGVDYWGVGGFEDREEGKYEHRIIFTDSQYWKDNVNAMSFANRIMTNALHTSYCVFIGLSMTDINILRWLALRRLELVEDAIQIAMRQHRDADRAIRSATRTFFPIPHFWVRPDADDTTGFLSHFLKERGVISVPIKSWKDNSFGELIARCSSKRSRPRK